MNGKERCRALKRIRREIADANGIALEIPVCTYEGDCEGTCPRCEEEMRILREGLEAIRAGGGTVVVPHVPLEPRTQDADSPFVEFREKHVNPQSFRTAGVPYRPLRKCTDFFMDFSPGMGQKKERRSSDEREE